MGCDSRITPSVFAAFGIIDAAGVRTGTEPGADLDVDEQSRERALQQTTLVRIAETLRGFR